jgi:alpha-tubulin suppressor-like RCC1 family protein
MLGAVAGVFWVPACDGTGLRFRNDGSSTPDRVRGDGSGDEQACLIGPDRFPSGSVNPQNACQSCQPSLSTTDWSDISSGPGCLSLADSHSCAVVNGSAWCWGFNPFGVLGNGAYGSSATPVLVQGLKPGVQAIATSFGRGFALVQGGVQGWGSAYLGNGSTEDSLVPVPVRGLQSGVQAVGAGLTFACALSKGEVWCWGFSSWQLFGSSTKSCQKQENSAQIDCLVPVKIGGLPANVQVIAAGDDHMCAIADDGVWCWGKNSFRQVSPDDPAVTRFVGTPRRIEGLPSGLQALVAGGDRNCVLANGSVYCWGNILWGDPDGGIVVDGIGPTLVTGLPSTVRGLAVGDSHSCALLDDGVMCWGENSLGTLGNNSRTNSPVPVRVQGLPLPVRAIAAGGPHTCALVSDGIWCWGSNSSGELGNGSKTDTLVPVRVQGLPGF